MGFVRVAEAASVPPGSGKVVVAEDRELALFNVEGTFYCLDNSCPHRDGPLGEGDLDGEIVYCPWHAWPFNVTTGAGQYGLNICVATHVCKVEEGAVYVEL